MMRDIDKLASLLSAEYDFDMEVLKDGKTIFIDGIIDDDEFDKFCVKYAEIIFGEILKLDKNIIDLNVCSDHFRPSRDYCINTTVLILIDEK